MKKLILLFSLVSTWCINSFAQVTANANPGMNFQAVAFDPQGKVLTQLPLTIKISFSSKADLQQVYYSETHKTTSNELGLFSVVVGEGSERVGEILGVPWSKQGIWLDVEAVSNDQRNFNIKHSTQLKAVPYAFYAATAAKVLEQDNSLEKNQSIYWHTGGNTSTLPPTHFLGTRDAKNLVFKTNADTNAIVTSDGQVQIYGRNTGSDEDMDNYPLLVTGSKQGIYIKVDGSRTNDNNFVTFVDDIDKWGEIQGQTFSELEGTWEYQLQVALFALEGAGLVAGAVTVIAQAVGLYAAGTGAAASLIFAFAAPGFYAAAVATTAKGITIAIEAAALLAESITWATNIRNDIGVEYDSGAGDYAEWLERNPAERDLQFGEIVGVKAGKVSLDTKDADHVLVVSRRPIVLGNAPQPDQEHKYEKIAFLGQVPVKVVGKVDIGDYVLASGNQDGLGIAVHPSKMQAADYRNVVGVAWEAAKDNPINVVKIGIGLNKNDLAPQVEAASQKIDNIIAYLEGKGPLHPDSPLKATPSFYKAPAETADEAAANVNFDQLVDSNADFFKDYYSKLAAQMESQGMDLSQAPELDALFKDPIKTLKKMRRDPAFKEQWKLIDQKLKSTH
jgi:hypothetical protein